MWHSSTWEPGQSEHKRDLLTDIPCACQVDQPVSCEPSAACPDPSSLSLLHSASTDFSAPGHPTTAEWLLVHLLEQDEVVEKDLCPSPEPAPSADHLPSHSHNTFQTWPPWPAPSLCCVATVPCCLSGSPVRGLILPPSMPRTAFTRCCFCFCLQASHCPGGDRALGSCQSCFLPRGSRGSSCLHKPQFSAPTLIFTAFKAS